MRYLELKRLAEYIKQPTEMEKITEKGLEVFNLLKEVEEKIGL